MQVILVGTVHILLTQKTMNVLVLEKSVSMFILTLEMPNKLPPCMWSKKVWTGLNF
jgi:hypothetical protein